MKIPELLLKIQRTLPDGTTRRDIARDAMGLSFEEMQQLVTGIFIEFQQLPPSEMILHALLTGAVIAERHARTKRPN